MRAVQFHEHGSPSVLQCESIESPTPSAGTVLVSVRAAGVNPVDTYFRSGEYAVPELPAIPGTDLAGEVVAVGAGVTAFESGDRVFATGLGGDGSGSYAEEVVVPVDQVAMLPDGVSFETGAAAGVVVGTAWRALVDHAALTATETVLIQGANGGVGHVAVQLAASMGARVLATAREPYHDRLESLGADHVFSYDRDDLAGAITDVGAPDVILETFVDEYLQFDADVGANGVRVVCIGNATNEASLTSVNTAKNKDVRYQFMTLFNAPDMSAILERVAALLDSGDVVPQIERSYTFEDADAAQRDVLEESFLGKLVLVP
ncbi:NADPH:quinone reductase [Halocatena halophila]|uniref:NADPH:quinone reductase n=1 Tax=Halocatena halophila TaxID=2814576 RepID=UPI002ED6A1C3